MAKTYIKPESGLKTKITGERVEIILNNPDLSAEALSKMTDGLSIPVVKTIKEVKKKGLRTKYNPRK